MRPAHPLPITATAFKPRRPVIQFATSGCLPLGSERAGGFGPLPWGPPLIQFRSVALAGAGLIAGFGLAGPCDAVRARIERVFAVSKMIGVAGLHEPNVDRGAEHDAPQFEAPGA